MVKATKGGGLEREVAKDLSRWVTHGKRIDVFWRSATSGARAAFSKGKVHQAGDIVAIEPVGQVLTRHWLIECKFRAELNIDSFIFHNKGLLAAFWKKTCNEAKQYNRMPMIIGRQNFMPTLVITRVGDLDELWIGPNAFLPYCVLWGKIEFRRFDELMQTRFCYPNPVDSTTPRLRSTRPHEAA